MLTVVRIGCRARSSAAIRCLRLPSSCLVSFVQTLRYVANALTYHHFWFGPAMAPFLEQRHQLLQVFKSCIGQPRRVCSEEFHVFWRQLHLFFVPEHKITKEVYIGPVLWLPPPLLRDFNLLRGGRLNFMQLRPLVRGR
ncbi:hypothetical protein FA10DRAFT_28375 [Acaromyces ingoldii]|uniref:Uncharacterized protein n=1 Tax=Acaromyces ingoldii TaxID=215250 RepID=A0A316YX36_9BASI|nr:hypothetical protein FA10DRAFT_28375 [Acaromyces ingoldii]PWN93672.1 hypothetical protein FA10DRAFT_28375 [Acaromyces ingoldii]